MGAQAFRGFESPSLRHCESESESAGLAFFMARAGIRTHTGAARPLPPGFRDSSPLAPDSSRQQASGAVFSRVEARFCVRTVRFPRADIPAVRFPRRNGPSAMKLPTADAGAFLPSGFSPMQPCRPQSCRQAPAPVVPRYSSRTRAAKAADSSTKSSRRSTRSEPFHHRSMLRTTPPAAKSARSTRPAAAGALPCR